MDSLKLIFVGIAVGIRDAILGIAALYHLDKSKLELSADKSAHGKEQFQPETILSKRRAQAGVPKPISKREKPKILHRILQCCALNGGVFGLSILVFHHGVIPWLQVLMGTLFGASPGLSSVVWSWMKPVLLCTFSALWVLPLFLLSKVVNSLWFQDIADSAYRNLRGRPQLLSSISKLVADALFSVLIQALFLLQSMLVSLLPIAPLGEIVSIVHLSLLYSLYAFEYKWFNMGWELHKRLSFIEHNWPYFVGFGLPLAISTALPSSYFISGCVFSILFPLFIISGNEATPMTGTCEYPLQLFSPVVCLSNALFHRTIGPNANVPSGRQMLSTPPLTPAKETLKLKRPRSHLSLHSSPSSNSSTRVRKEKHASRRGSSLTKDTF